MISDSKRDTFSCSPLFLVSVRKMEPGAGIKEFVMPVNRVSTHRPSNTFSTPFVAQSKTPQTTIGHHTVVRTTVGNKKFQPNPLIPRNLIQPQTRHEYNKPQRRRSKNRRHKHRNYDEDDDDEDSSDELPKRIVSHDGKFDYTRTNTPLGEGAFSKCFLVKDNQSDVLAAGKFFTRDASSSQKKLERFEREVNLMRLLIHPNIVRFYADISGVPNNRKLNTFQERDHVSFKHPPLMVMEYCSGGSISSIMKQRRPKHLHEDQRYGTLSHKETLWVAECCARALVHIKEFRIIHRDVKMGNLLLQSAPMDKYDITTVGIVLCDFGLATQVKHGETRAKGTAGTPNYMAPEVVTREGACFASDMWSLGVTMFHCLTGRCPFPARDVDTTYDRIERNDYRWRSHEKETVSRNMRNLVDSILVSDPHKRLTAERLLQEIEILRNQV